MIEHLWSTPILKTTLALNPADRATLLDLSLRYAVEQAEPHSLPKVAGQTMKYQRNMYKRKANSESEAAALGRFKALVLSEYRKYIAAAYGVSNADEIKISIRSIPVVQEHGQRTMPHYHHTCDHVCCYYLDTGEPVANADPRIGNGELIACDPRPMRTFPFWEKTHWITTYPGLFVLHPAGVWHETNTFSGTGKRVLIATTLRVESHNYTDLYVPA